MTFPKRLILLSCLSIALGILAFALPSNASPSDNVSGYAWSSNVGWTSLNNCTSPSNCTGPNYGMNIQPGGPGTVSGHVWNANIGWISFEPSAVAGCPAGFSQCAPVVDWTTATAGLYKMKGWARVCSGTRNPSSCTGVFSAADIAFATDPANNTEPLALEYRAWLARTGGWDGFIALGVPSTATASHWPGSTGVMATPGGVLSGYAWGSEVVGWMKFNPSSIPECSDGVDNADTEDVLWDHNDIGCLSGPGNTYDPLDPSENNPECSDVIDNADTDTLADTNDPGCHTDGNADDPGTYDEFDPSEDDLVPMVTITATPTTFSTATERPILNLTATNFSGPITCSIEPSSGGPIGRVPMVSTGINSWRMNPNPPQAPVIDATTEYVAECTNTSGSSDTDEVTVTKEAADPGICADGHYECVAGDSTDPDDTGQNSAGQNIWSWTCESTGGGDDDMCEEVFPQCSDGIDNADAEDRLADILDPGCHINERINTVDPNISYDKNDNNEGNKRKPIFIEF